MAAIIAGINKKNKEIAIMNAIKSSIQNKTIRTVTISIGKNFNKLRIVSFNTCSFVIVFPTQIYY